MGIFCEFGLRDGFGGLLVLEETFKLRVGCSYGRSVERVRRIVEFWGRGLVFRD